MHLFDFLKDLYLELGLSDIYAEILKSITLFLFIFIFASIINLIVKKYVIWLIKKIAKKTTLKFDDIIVNQKLILYITHLVPAAIIHLLIKFVFNPDVKYPFDYQSILDIVDNLILLYVLIILWMVVFAAINAFHTLFKTWAISERVDIKGFLQLIKVLVSIVFIIMLVSVIVDKKPGAILAAFGAVAAALIFVFKDTLLGFVAGIQIAANKMLKPGDWISMPDMNADGTVLEIGLTTVKIQNWDKTISTVPTYSLVNQSFANWKGMEESGGRRFKKSIFIDVNSIKFCDEKMIDKLKKFYLLRNYIESKQLEISEYNKSKAVSEETIFNSRRLTNIGTFRKYIEFYLKENKFTKKDFTILVRQLQVTPNGLPLEIYVFLTEQKWIEYEEIQSDIFDYIFSVIHEFDLKLFQNPTGFDFRNFTNKT
ncbi:MAG: mechanosensitive ion channel [Bacteroidales bacterium]|nr:mechanosensitive ion channel [Bacteroidales bacterium]MBN2755952.1 mechanosensitive ion channel [Bacteroidales bacterium]